MPRGWKFFCCACDTEESDHEQARDYRARQKRSKTKSSKKTTWTRRSLLEHEQSEFQEVPYEHMAYQMKPREPPKYHGEVEYKLVENPISNKKRHVQEVFADDPYHSHVSKTTFPWMDESFVPNARTGTHLGISSVQINVKRNEISNSKSREIARSSENNVHNAQYKLTGTSHSFNEELLGSPVNQAHCPKVTNVRTIPNEYGFNDKITKATNKTKIIPRSGGPDTSNNRPLVLRAPKSDVGVRPLTNHTLLHHNYNKVNVSKLPGYNGSHSDIGQRPVARYIPNPDVVNKFPEQIYENQHRENHSDVSFSSEVTFRKSDVSYSVSDVSYKRNKRPGVFSSHSENYERLKVPASKPKRNSKKINDYDTIAESMYGYVPRAVQSVHASNALEGYQIDDFFNQRMNSRELDSFASINSTSDQTSEEDTVIVTSLVENEARSSNRNLHISKENGGVDQRKENTFNCNKFENGGCGIKINKPPTKSGENSQNIPFRSPEQAHVANSGDKNNATRGDSEKKDENENKIIMIDFPPNLDGFDSANKKPTGINSVSMDMDTSETVVSRRSNQTTNTSTLERAEVLY